MSSGFVESIFAQKRAEAKGGLKAGGVFFLIALVLLALHYVFKHGIGWAIGGYFVLFVTMVLVINGLKGINSTFQKSTTRIKLSEFGDPDSIVSKVNQEFASGIEKENINFSDIHKNILNSLKDGSTPNFKPFLWKDIYYISPSFVVVSLYGKDPVIVPREAIGVIRLTTSILTSYGEEVSRTYGSEIIAGDENLKLPGGLEYEENILSIRNALSLSPWAYLQNPPEEAYQPDKGVQKLTEGARGVRNFLLGRLWWISPYGWIMRLSGKNKGGRATIKKISTKPIQEKLNLRKSLLVKILRGEEIPPQYKGEVDSLKYNLDFISGKVNELT